MPHKSSLSKRDLDEVWTGKEKRSGPSRRLRHQWLTRSRPLELSLKDLPSAKETDTTLLRLHSAARRCGELQRL
ncbi:hypothetical protein NPIL_519821 [Nephila pilipes]|uniref:Uncharacterized protein n=1 Tax=Nephila pilipes TaxID=299642 RepID=A0A8X6NPV7_NEPPI|nr:hypothetical protein NPIL_519821 [Nephila pilipes]